MRDKNFWKVITGDADVEIVFVVAHQDVELRLVSFYQFRLDKKRLGFGVGLNPVNAIGLVTEPPRFVRSVGAKIRSKPRAQVRGFADVKNLGAVPEPIDPGQCGRPAGGLIFEFHSGSVMGRIVRILLFDKSYHTGGGAMISRRWVTAVFLVLLVAAFVAGAARVVSGASPEASGRRDRMRAEAFEYFWEIVQLHAIDPPPKGVKEKCRREGILTCLDRFSGIVTERQMQDLRGKVGGKYGAIGVQLTFWNGRAVVIGTSDNSPAARAGIRPGDVIVKVDGYDMRPEAFGGLADYIRGPEGTSVALWVERDGIPLAPMILIRAAFDLQSISVFDIDREISLIRINNFSEAMPEQLLRAVVERAGAVSSQRTLTVRRDGRKFIFDLRDNRGGLIAAAYALCALFSSNPGDIIVTIHSRNSETPVRVGHLPPALRGVLEGLRVAVLVNEGTASSAEIVAEFLKQKGVPLVGKPTFGKGSVQGLFPYGSLSLLVTTARYAAGNDEIEVDRAGITPTHDADFAPFPHSLSIQEFVAKRFSPEYDSQVKAAYDLLKNIPSAGR